MTALIVQTSPRVYNSQPDCGDIKSRGLMKHVRSARQRPEWNGCSMKQTNCFLSIYKFILCFTNELFIKVIQLNLLKKMKLTIMFSLICSKEILLFVVLQKRYTRVLSVSVLLCGRFDDSSSRRRVPNLRSSCCLVFVWFIMDKIYCIFQSSGKQDCLELSVFDSLKFISLELRSREINFKESRPRAPNNPIFLRTKIYYNNDVIVFSGQCPLHCISRLVMHYCVLVRPVHGICD